MNLVTSHFLRKTGLAMALSILAVTGASAQTAAAGAKPAKPAVKKPAAAQSLRCQARQPTTLKARNKA